MKTKLLSVALPCSKGVSLDFKKNLEVPTKRYILRVCFLQPFEDSLFSHYNYAATYQMKLEMNFHEKILIKHACRFHYSN